MVFRSTWLRGIGQHHRHPQGGNAVISGLFLGGSGTTPAPTSAAGITPGAVFAGKFVAMSNAEQQAVMSQLKRAGVRWLRLDVPSDFRFDIFVQDATRNGIQVDAVLEAWTTPLGPSAFSTFATAAVRHLKPFGVETYEVLNEPNCDEYCLSAASYTGILKASYTAVKSARKVAA